ncbi:MAG: hypothetical protein ETSY2_32950 [Candidatus Entotheonella gemina]|uniref:Uncharacterized protein n=1 Tax=Candidatus Entotheonella gemina TaxID=1429439 RepID=W4M1S5_9BACT|nr:MAG: hypothetical protein ETSY2_32950 [Candidatus Entotheonella gemina]
MNTPQPPDHHGDQPINRRAFLHTASVATATIVVAGLGTRTVAAEADKYAPPDKSALPPSTMSLDLPRTALVVTDPQIDFLSPKGVTWEVVGKNVTELHTVANIGRLFATAKQAEITVAVSPHYYYPTDKGWQFEGAL